MKSSETRSLILHILESKQPNMDLMRQWAQVREPWLTTAMALHLQCRATEAWESPAELASVLTDVDVHSWPPEAQQVVARLVLHGLPLTVNPTRVAAEPNPLLRTEWFRAALVQQPRLLKFLSNKPLGPDVLRDLPPESVVNGGLLREMLDSDVPFAQLEAVDCIARGLKQGVVAPPDAQMWLVHLAARDSGAAAESALKLLSQPWSAMLDPPDVREHLKHDSERAVLAVRLLHQRHALSELLRVLDDPEASARTKREAIVAVGELGGPEDLKRILDVSFGDVRYFGTGCLEALVLFKRRGVSADDDDARRIAELCLGNPELPLDAAAEVLSSRADLVVSWLSSEWLQQLDTTWERAVQLLEKIGTRKAIQRLVELVESNEPREAWSAAITALGNLHVVSAERTILSRLRDEPESCLGALAHVGGEDTARVLEEELLDPARPLLPCHTRAAALLVRIDPSLVLVNKLMALGELTPHVLASLPAYCTVEQHQVLGSLASSPGHPLRMAALQALGRTGGPHAISLLSYALNDPDEQVRETARSALRVLGPRLKHLGATQPLGIHDSEDPAGLVLADALLMRLQNRSLRTDEILCLLEPLVGTRHSALVRTVRPLLRHRSPAVRAHAIMCLASCGPAATAWILPALVEDLSGDIRVLRRALEVLGTVRATWLSNVLVRWLDHSNMNIKKTAATSLVNACSVHVVPSLLRWLAFHDNPGLRELLATALQSVLGEWLPAVVLFALEKAQSPREAELIVSILDGMLEPDVVASFVGQTGILPPQDPLEPRRQLVRSLWAQAIRLRNGTLGDMEAAFRRRGLQSWIPCGEGEPPQSQWLSQFRLADASRAAAHLKRELRAWPPPVADKLDIEAAGSLALPLDRSLATDESLVLVDRYASSTTLARACISRLLGQSPDVITLACLGDIIEQTPDSRVPDHALRLSTVLRWNVTTAAVALGHADASVSSNGARFLLQQGILNPASWPRQLTPILLQRMVVSGEVDACGEWLGGLDHQVADLGVTLLSVLGADETRSTLLRWLRKHAALHSQLVTEIGRAGEGSAEHENALRSLVQTTVLSNKIRGDVLCIMAGRRGSAHHSFLHTIAPGTVCEPLTEAARQLWCLSGPRDRALLLQQYVDGLLPEWSIEDLAPISPLLLRGLEVHKQSRNSRARFLQVLKRTKGMFAAARMLECWREEEDKEIAALARDALRDQPSDVMVPLLEPDIRAKRPAWIETTQFSSAILARFASTLASNTESLSRIASQLARGSGPATLFAPGLAEQLLEGLDEANAHQRVGLLLRLSDWCVPRRAAELASAIKPWLQQHGVRSLMPLVVNVLGKHPPSLRARILILLGTDEEVVRSSLVDAVLEDPGVMREMPERVQTSISKEMSRALEGRDVEQIRSILNHRARCVGSAADNEALVADLERAMTHRSPRVRHLAHRLLSQHAPRPRYLEITRTLLASSDVMTVRRGLRVLAFQGALDAVPDISELLVHPLPQLRKAARETLLVLGEAAIPGLRTAMTRARPDRRAVLQELQVELTK